MYPLETDCGVQLQMAGSRCLVGKLEAGAVIAPGATVVVTTTRLSVATPDTRPAIPGSSLSTRSLDLLLQVRGRCLTGRIIRTLPLNELL